MKSFPFLDLLFVVVIFLLFLRGSFKGLLKESFSLGIVILAFYLVNSWEVFFSPLKSILSDYGLGTAFLRSFFFGIFWFIQALFLFVIFKFINLNVKGCLSRILGGVICTFKGYILFFLIFPSLLNNSSLEIKFLEKSSTLLFPFFEKMRNHIYDLISLINI